jgi:hypothetical protein
VLYSATLGVVNQRNAAARCGALILYRRQRKYVVDATPEVFDDCHATLRRAGTPVAFGKLAGFGERGIVAQIERRNMVRNASNIMGRVPASGNELDRALDAYMRPTAGGRSKVPGYSSDIVAAWEVLHFLHEQGWGSRVGFGHDGTPGTYCVLRRGDKTIWGNADDDHAPLAICRAALRAVSERVEDGHA